MDPVRVIEVKQDVLGQNNQRAQALRAKHKADNRYFVNLMSSPGSGKTTTLLQTKNHLDPNISLAVMEADIDSTVDAEKLTQAGIDAIQVHTGGMCHLDAAMVEQGLQALPNKAYDLVILENVGNLVCPAEFDTGATINVAILSVPEGDDKPLKYPLMFEVADVVIINKLDVAPYFDFDVARAKQNILARNPNARIFCVSAKTGEGIDAWATWLASEVAAQKGGRA